MYKSWKVLLFRSHKNERGLDEFFKAMNAEPSKSSLTHGTTIKTEHSRTETRTSNTHGHIRTTTAATDSSQKISTLHGQSSSVITPTLDITHIELRTVSDLTLTSKVSDFDSNTAHLTLESVTCEPVTR